MCLQRAYVVCLVSHISTDSDVLMRVFRNTGGGQHGSLQGAAAATLASVLSKRMEPQPKLQLIVQLDAAAAVEQWESIATPAGELDEELAEQLTSLLNVLACETIESVKRIENQVISMQVRYPPSPCITLGVRCFEKVRGPRGTPRHYPPSPLYYNWSPTQDCVAI